MTAQPLGFNPISLATEVATNRLNSGALLNFDLTDNIKGQLQITPVLQQPESLSTQPLTKMASFQTPAGAITLDNSFELVRLISTAPIDEDDQPDSIYWTLAINHIVPALKPLFGQLVSIPLIEPKNTTDQHLLHWQISHSETKDSQKPQTIEHGGYILLDSATLTQWLNHIETQPDWQACHHPSSNQMAELPINFALKLADLHLTVQQYQSLNNGDVLIPQQRHFEPSGLGHLYIGKQRLTIKWLKHQQYEVIANDTSERSMSETTDHLPPQTEDEITTEDETTTEEQPTNQLDALELHLTIEAGQVVLPLKQLQSLTVGSIITANGVTPGHGYLRHGNSIVGRGILVDVEGRLGLQLQSLESHHAD